MAPDGGGPPAPDLDALLDALGPDGVTDVLTDLLKAEPGPAPTTRWGVAKR